ncbi:MAG: transcriptional regulator [Micrococcales bacterium]|nr:transcriptional regulator [Micrococcales bacterium]
MSAPHFDELVHQPHRLRICVILSAVEQASFQALCEELGVSMPTLSKQLRMLADAGYVTTDKRPSGTRPATWATLTKKGRAALQGHLAALRELADQAQ